MAIGTAIHAVIDTAIHGDWNSNTRQLMQQYMIIDAVIYGNWCSNILQLILQYMTIVAAIHGNWSSNNSCKTFCLTWRHYTSFHWPNSGKAGSLTYKLEESIWFVCIPFSVGKLVFGTLSPLILFKFVNSGFSWYVCRRHCQYWNLNTIFCLERHNALPRRPRATDASLHFLERGTL